MQRVRTGSTGKQFQRVSQHERENRMKARGIILDTILCRGLVVTVVTVVQTEQLLFSRIATAISDDSEMEKEREQRTIMYSP